MLHGTGRSEKLHRPRFSTIWEAAGASRAGAQPEDVSANIAIGRRRVKRGRRRPHIHITACVRLGRGALRQESRRELPREGSRMTLAATGLGG